MGSHASRAGPAARTSGIPLAAWIHDVTGSFDLAFQIFLAIYALSGLLIVGLRLPAAAPESGHEPRVA